MKPVKVILLSLFFIQSTNYSSAVAGKPSADRAPKARYLFLIVANGIRYGDAFGNGNHLYTDNIWTKLRPLGTVCSNMFNRKVTRLVPAHQSLLAGMWHIQEKSGSVVMPSLNPTLFEYWNKGREADTCYFAAQRKDLDTLYRSGHAEYGKTVAPMFDEESVDICDTCSLKATADLTENPIYTNAVSRIFKFHPSFVYLILDDSSTAASPHALECRVDGCDESESLNGYYESIILTDTIVFDLWNRIQSDEIYRDRSVFVFMGTHGRHTDDFSGFGDDCRGCQHLNFLIIGPGIKKNFISEKKRTLIDICPTVGLLCGIPTPFAEGKTMRELLE